MGASASSLTVEQKAILTRRLQEAFEQLTADGLEEDIVKDSMTSEYNKIIKSFPKAQEEPNVEPVKASPNKSERIKPESTKMVVSTSAKDLSSKFPRPSSSSKNSKNSKFSRRRSFDQNDKGGASQKIKSPSLKDAVAEAAAAVSKLTAASEDVVDSWDSVSQQPFCTICQMAFKSIDFLDRHTKYSDLHTKNIERRDKKDSRVAEVFQKVAVIEEEPQAPVTRTESRQVEGQHYKLLYTGSKFFWRSQKNIDVDIYLHILPHVIEVISFDPVKHREASRIYLNYYTIQDTLEQLVAGDLAEKLRELAQDRFRNPEDESALRDQLLVQRVITYILQRLQLDSTGNLGEMKYVQQYGDSDLQSPLMDSAPQILVPVSLTRRRRTSAEEIEATINSISFDRTAIGAALNLAASYSASPTKKKSVVNMQAASRISAHIHAAVQYMTAKRWYHEVSVPKRRFIQAVRKVIRQALVGQTKAVLVAKEKSLQLLGAGSPEMSKVSRKYSMRSRPREV